MQGISSLPFSKKLLVLGLSGLALALILLVNWSIWKILSLLFDSYLAFLFILLAYYYSFRHLVRMLAFPGISVLMKRTLESDYCKRMAQNVLKQIHDFRSCLEMFTGPVAQESERVEFLNLASKRTMMIIASMEHQIEGQRESQQIVHHD
jgi:hypothetical protein